MTELEIKEYHDTVEEIIYSYRKNNKSKNISDWVKYTFPTLYDDTNKHLDVLANLTMQSKTPADYDDIKNLCWKHMGFFLGINLSFGYDKIY